MSDEDLEALKELAKEISAKAAAEAVRATEVARLAAQDRQHANERWAALHEMIQSEMRRINSISQQIAVELKLKKLAMGNTVFGSYAATAKSLVESYEVMALFQFDDDYILMVAEQTVDKRVKAVQKEPAKISEGTPADIRQVLTSITKKAMTPINETVAPV